MPEEIQGDRVQALEATALRDPASPLYLPLAERLREQGRTDEAIRLCESRRNRPGRGVGDHIVLGRCYLADGRLADARAEFEAALSLDRENVVALKALAGIDAHEGSQARAADFYRAVCRIDPGDLESQTALHQITSGEFADVCPADVVVGQGDLTWHPVRLPREEEHLPNLGLGLRTLDRFDEAPSDAARRRSGDFRELSLDELERIGTPASAPPPAGAADPATPAEAHAPREADAAPSPEPAKPPHAGGVPGNKSAFQEWVRRLGGGA